MYSNLRISFKLILIIILVLNSLNFVSAQDFFIIRNGLEIENFGKFESNLPLDSEIAGNVTVIRENNIIKSYKVKLLEGEKFIPVVKYVDNIYGVVNFITEFEVAIENDKAKIKGDASVKLPSLKGIIAKGTNLEFTIRNGVFSDIKSMKIDGSSDFELNGLDIIVPGGVIFEEVNIVSNVVQSLVLKNKLDQDLKNINIGKIKNIWIRRGGENYVRIEIKGSEYELTGRGSSVGEFELSEQDLIVDSTGKVLVPISEQNTITLKSGEKEVVVSKLEKKVGGVMQPSPFARGAVTIVGPGKSVQEIEGAAVQFGVDQDNKLNLVFKEFSAAEIFGFGKIENGKPFPDRKGVNIGTTVFVNRAVFYNGPRKVELVYERSDWKEITTNKIIKKQVERGGISNERKVRNVLNFLGNVRGIGRGGYLEYLGS
ncbi:MAG: hypothetical protein AABW46_00140 [Nanoarchaeota archaeon]